MRYEFAERFDDGLTVLNLDPDHDVANPTPTSNEVPSSWTTFVASSLDSNTAASVAELGPVSTWAAATGRPGVSAAPPIAKPDQICQARRTWSWMCTFGLA